MASQDRVTILNKTLTLANTEYSVTAPASTRALSLWVSERPTGVSGSFRVAFATGYVAGPAEPYIYVRPNGVAEIEGQLGGLTVYLAGDTDGIVLEGLAVLT